MKGWFCRSAAVDPAFPASVRRFKPPRFLSGQAASTSEACRFSSAHGCLCRRCSRRAWRAFLWYLQHHFYWTV